jgi:hypothetical protein
VAAGQHVGADTEVEAVVEEPLVVGQAVPAPGMAGGERVDRGQPRPVAVYAVEKGGAGGLG